MKICRNIWQVHPFIVNLEESKAFQGPESMREKRYDSYDSMGSLKSFQVEVLVIDMRMQNATLRLEH